MSRLVFAAILILLLALVAPALAQPKPVEARGFSPGEVYDYSGLDSVNLFNGNLVLALPLGGQYPLGGGFSYGLRLTYNAKVWDVETRPFSFSEAAFEARVSEDFNAGVGWTVSLGGYLTNSQFGDNPNGWNLTTEDGAQHHFYQSLHVGEATGTAFQYTRDGSYLRLTKSSREVEYPDGTIRTFGQQEPGVPGKFRLTQIRDRFGNAVTVTYNDGAQPSWTIADGLRTHRVELEVGSAGVRRVKAVKLAAFNGSVATYSFGYTSKTIMRSCWDSPASLYPSGFSDPTPPTATVDFLTSLTLPGTGGAFEMPQHYEDCSQSKNAPGVLKRLRLPTRGLIDWTYTDWDVLTRSPLTLNRGPDTEPAIGSQEVLAVASKTVLNSNGLCENHDWPSCSWTYRTEGGGGFTRKVIVREPSGDETVHYFANSPHLNRAGFSGWEYGLPFHLTNAQSGLHLSREIYDGTEASGVLKRSVRVSYEHDKLKPGDTIRFTSDWYDSNRRPRVERTTFHDDNHRWVETVSSDFDGLGQHRVQATTANWGSNRTTTTTYNPARGTYLINPSNNLFASGHSFTPWPSCQPWLLQLSTSRETQDGSDRVRVETCFDSNSGFLERERRLKGTSRGSEDVIVEYEVGSYGAVTGEKHFGGDHAGLTTSSSWCTAGLGTPDYRMAHTIEHRLSAKTKFLTPGGGTLPLREGHFVRNLTIDKSTGLPKRSVDPAGLITDYSYDALGRLTAEKPTSGAWVEYEYKKPTSSQLARINVRRRAQGQTTGTALTSQAYWYDSFGRVWHERDELPGGVTSKQVSSYYPNGWLRWKSVAHSGTTSGVKKTFHQDYDPFGRPAEIVPPDGAAHAIDFEYRGIRQVKRTVSVASGTAGQETPSSTIERSDAYGRLVEVEEPSAPGSANVSTHYTYDAANRLSRVQTTAQGVSQTRLFDYDGRGFLTREKHPELGTFGNGSVEFSDYDALGNAGRRRIGAVNGAFDLLQDYDAQGRLSRIRERGGLQRPIKEFTYGTGAWAGNRSLGKVETAIRHNWIAPPWNPSAGEVDVSVQEVYTFGGVAGRPSQRRTTLSSLQTFHQSWVYDDLGNVTSRTYPQCLHPPCAGTTTNRTVPNSYTRGRLTAVPGYAPSITYHDHGMLDTVVHANGTSTYHRKDAFGIRRPGSIGASGVVGLMETTPLQQGQGLVYQYDGAGNVKFLGDEVYQYDAVSRVVKGTMGGGNSQSYTYDAFGNISAVTTVRSGVSTTRGYGIVRSTNRLSATGYDAAGNQLHFGSGTTGYTYTWDALSKLRSKQSGNGAIEDYYLYTADDERINTLHWAESPIEETWTLRDLGGQVLRTWGTVGGSAGTWNHREDHVHRDGQLLASWRPAEGLRFFHLDHLGTPRLITKADGRSAGLHTYFPFGEESVPNGSTERMKFTGHERDLHGTAGQGDDLDYMHARYCNPLNGRFLSVDPARESGKPGAPQSWNRYAYGRGNPVKFVDPDGRETAAVLAMERDNQALLNGEISSEQYFDNAKARAGGAMLGVSLLMPGPEDAVIAGIAAKTLRAYRAAKEIRKAKQATRAAEAAQEVPRRTARTTPRDLPETLALDEAQGGAGKRIMQGKINDPEYPEDAWAKMQHVHENPDGTRTVVHYWENLKTGAREGFKFK